MQFFKKMISQAVKIDNNAAIQFLSDAGKILSESLDYETILKATAVLVLDVLADLCLIDLIEDNNHNQGKTFRRILSMPKDVSKDALASELMNFTLDSDSDDSVKNVIDSHQGYLIPDFFAEVGRNKVHPRYLELLNQLNCGAAVMMPLESHDKLFGIITLVRHRNEPKYSPTEIELLSEFARRAAMAIENARLYRQSQQAIEAKTQFLANMSHEIRTPLGVMLGFVELLQEQQMPFEQQKHYLKIIARNGQQLLALVSDLLDMSRIDLGKIEINPLELSLVELVHEAVAGFALAASEKKLKIVTDFSPSVPDKIKADPLRLRQIIINLLSNAIKFSSASVIQVKITSQKITDNQDSRALITMDVTDQGIGIAPDKQAKLFQAFSQADFTMTRKFGGAGLGLFLSRKIAKVMGGDVELVLSEPGKGSTFRFTFITETVTLASQAAEEKPAEHAVEIKKNYLTKKVLVVEDSPDNQLLISKILENEHLELDKAENGEQALQKAAQKHYDLILMDIQMPLIDGYAATLRLRQMGISTPIIALTAHALPSDRKHCQEVGCNGFISKPIDKVAFKNTVRSFL